MTQTKRDTLALQGGGLGVRLTTPPCKKILLRNLKRRPRPTQGCRADGDDISPCCYNQIQLNFTVMTIAQLHNCLRRSTHSAAVFTSLGTFDHEVDGKLVEGTGEIEVHYFSSETCPGGLLHIAEEVGDENAQYCHKKGAHFMASKFYIKFILCEAFSVNKKRHTCVCKPRTFRCFNLHLQNAF
jgi:hypothetical protein